MIYLTELTQISIENALKLRNDEKYNQYFRQTGKITLPQQVDWFLRLHKDETQNIFTIKKNCEFLGIGGLTSIDLINRKAELSCYVKDWNMKDYKEAIRLIIGYGFNTLGLHRIWAEPFENHRIALKILPELGFKEEGRLKHSYFKNGKWIDSIIQAIVNN